MMMWFEKIVNFICNIYFVFFQSKIQTLSRWSISCDKRSKYYRFFTTNT